MKRWLLSVILCLYGSLIWAEPEDQLIQVLRALQQGHIDKALSSAEVLKKTYPNYRLGQLLWLQLNATLAGDTDLLARLQQRHGMALQRLLAEAQVRWEHARDPLSPQQWVQRWIFRPGSQPWWVVVDLAGSRLYLFRNQNGQLVKVFDTYVSKGRKGIGKQREGDQRTPVGIYRIVDWIPDEKLPPLYGVGALPLDYPNPWDRLYGRTGSGIWLHGAPPDTWTRPPLSSRGCVVMSNQGVTALRQRFQLPFGTPVLLVDRLADYPPLATLPQALPPQAMVARYPGEAKLVWVAHPDGTQAFWQSDGEGGWQLALKATPVLAQR